MFGIKNFLFVLFMCFAVAVSNAQQVSKEQIKGLDEQVQDIKKDVLEISTELNLLEEKLLFPSNTQVSLFISLETSKGIEIDAVEVKVDGKLVANHIYSYKELQALREGGLQRVFTGNVLTGDHSLKVGFKGRNGAGNEFTEVGNYTFSKGIGPGLVEIRFVSAGIGNNVKFVSR